MTPDRFDLTDSQVYGLFDWLDSADGTRSAVSSDVILGIAAHSIELGGDGARIVRAAVSFRRALELERGQNIMAALGRL